MNLDKLFVAADEVIARGRADIEQPSLTPPLALARWLAMALGSSRSLAAPHGLSFDESRFHALGSLHCSIASSRRRA